jgi:outer membrane cobalamin receptor
MKTVSRHGIVFAVAFGLMHGTSSASESARSAEVTDTQRTGAVGGVVTSADGVPVRSGVVTVHGHGRNRSARTDAAGHFDIAGLEAGTYIIRVDALGYDPVGPRTIGIQTLATTDVTFTVVRSSSSLTTIGRVQANGSDALSTSSAPVSTINPQMYAAEGFTRISDVLQDDMSTTLVHPVGGGSTVLPTSVALRGPDPTETLVDLDGHQVNSGATGDFDLSLLDPADYASIELVKGISPSSLVGPDTIDGAINIRTLEPTLATHGMERFSFGSFNSFGETLEQTGTEGRLGYALSLHDTTTDGEVNGPIFDASTGTQATVGSSVDGKTALGKLRYAFGSNGASYAEFSFHDQSVLRDISAGLSSYAGAPASEPSGEPIVDGFEGSSLAAHNAGYGLDVRVPVGGVGPSGISQSSLLFRHYTSLVSQSVFGPGAETSPYLYDDRDLIGENSLEFDRQFSNGSLTLQYSIRNENLTITDTSDDGGDINLESVARYGLDASTATAGPADTLLTQTQRAAVLRYVYDPTANLHVTAAGYYSDYSIFGHEIDPRFGFVYTPDSRSALRFSVGSTYQAPQLPELYRPAVLPLPVAGIISTGNPDLRPDHATEYDLGLSHVFESGPHETDASIDVYRVNLRAPASTFVQAGTPSNDCVAPGTPATASSPTCLLSYAVNAGDGIYQGIEIAAQHRLQPYVNLRAGFAIRSAYLTAVPPSIQDGTLVVGQQDAGLPLQKATLSLTGEPPRGLTYRVGFVYDGQYNELNQAPFVTLAGAVGYRWPKYEIVLSGTNLTNVYDQRFTTTGGGTPYGVIGGDTNATNAYALQGAAVNLSVARRF